MYGDYLKDLLRPLRLYVLDEGPGAVELEVLGACLDAVLTELETCEAEETVATAEGRGLTAYEQLLPYVPAYLTLADRRRAIEALVRIDGGSFTLADMQDTISGCGIYAVVEEAETANTVKIYFPNNRGVPENFSELGSRVEQILPCHLAVEYCFVYLTFQELESLLSAWQELEARCPTWASLEAYGGENVE
jgi:hypothetical protein